MSLSSKGAFSFQTSIISGLSVRTCSHRLVKYFVVLSSITRLDAIILLFAFLSILLSSFLVITLGRASTPCATNLFNSTYRNLSIGRVCYYSQARGSQACFVKCSGDVNLGFAVSRISLLEIRYEVIQNLLDVARIWIQTAVRYKAML